VYAISSQVFLCLLSAAAISSSLALPATEGGEGNDNEPVINQQAENSQEEEKIKAEEGAQENDETDIVDGFVEAIDVLEEQESPEIEDEKQPSFEEEMPEDLLAIAAGFAEEEQRLLFGKLKPVKFFLTHRYSTLTRTETLTETRLAFNTCYKTEDGIATCHERRRKRNLTVKVSPIEKDAWGVEIRPTRVTRETQDEGGEDGDLGESVAATLKKAEEGMAEDPEPRVSLDDLQSIPSSKVSNWYQKEIVGLNKGCFNPLDIHQRFLTILEKE